MTNGTALVASGSAPALSEAIEQALVNGDLSKLSVEDRVRLYHAKCTSLGLNPLTNPFLYVNLSGKLVLYATKDCAEQLRKIHGLSITLIDRQRLDDVYIVTARASTPDGRTDESTGAVTIGNLKGDALCNALMKAETKSKRRVTLSICGLGILDETEIETVRGAEPVAFDDPAPTATAARGTVLPSNPRGLSLERRKDGFERFTALYGQAQKMGLKPDTLDGDISDQALVAAVNDLTERIAAAKEPASATA